MKRSVLVFATALTAFSLAACGGDDSSRSEASNDTAAGTTAGDAAQTSGADDAAATAARPYKVKSGIVETTIDMMGEQKQTMYFDDYGTKQATVTAVEIMGQKSETISITADGWMITYDPAKKEGTKMKAGLAAGSSAVPNIESLTADVKERYKLKETDARSIAGKDAKGFEMEAMGMPMKVWLWEGIPMRTEVSMGGKQPMVSEVKSIQTDVEIPADRFTVPADVKLKEM